MTPSARRRSYLSPEGARDEPTAWLTQRPPPSPPALPPILALCRRGCPRQILRYVGASDGNMAEGSMRLDVNVSLRPRGEAGFNTKVRSAGFLDGAGRKGRGRDAERASRA